MPAAPCTSAIAHHPWATLRHGEGTYRQCGERERSDNAFLVNGHGSLLIGTFQATHHRNAWHGRPRGALMRINGRFKSQEMRLNK
jgi:hypothetical protein